MSFCDSNSNIKRWSSEHITIPYSVIENGVAKMHRYYPDFYIERIDKNDPERFERVVIEIKPFKETKMPVLAEKVTAKALESYEYQLKMFQKNLYKWTRAVDWCKKNGMQFVIIHEGHLKQNNIM